MTEINTVLILSLVAIGMGVVNFLILLFKIRGKKEPGQQPDLSEKLVNQESKSLVFIVVDMENIPGNIRSQINELSKRVETLEKNNSPYKIL